MNIRHYHYTKYLISFWHILTQLFHRWSNDRIASLAAALAYYTLFSLAPILLICISIVGVVFGEEAARGQIIAQISGLVGHDPAAQIQDIIQSANKPNDALSARILSIIIFLFTASGVFNEIQEGLNTIWGVKTNPHQSWLALIKDRFLSFAMVLGCAFLLLVSLILSTFLAIVSSRISFYMGTSLAFDLVLNYLLSFGIITLLFALMFKKLPDVYLVWHDVWIGALVTSLLFSLGKMLIGVYLSHFHIASIFGAAGSLIIILVWIYYSSQIFFIGAEITKIVATYKGKQIIPTRGALLLDKGED